MQEQVKALTEQVTGLKVRVFDAEEALRGERNTISQFLQELVNIMHVPGDEKGAVTLEAITARAKELNVIDQAGAVIDQVQPVGVIEGEVE